MNGGHSTRNILREIGEFSLAVLTLGWRRKRELAFLALLALMSKIVSAYLILNGASMILIEEFSEVWNRISGSWDAVRSEEPSLWLQQYRIELESIEWNFANWDLLMLVGGAIIYLISVFIHGAVIARICMIDLLALHCSIVEALRWGIGRVARLSALFIKILAASIAIIMVLVSVMALGVAMSDVFVPVSVVLFATTGLTVLAIGGATMLMPGVLIVAFITSAVGPKKSTWRYTVQLIRGRFWATLGRVYLIAVVAVSIGTVTELLALTAVPDVWHAAYLISGAIELAGFTICMIAACVIYHDAGGEIA